MTILCRIRPPSVQVLLDNKRVLDGKGAPIDGTPAVMPLNPGSYVLTVQREGYVPWNEQVEIEGGRAPHPVRAKLEPLASSPASRWSRIPPGATAILDSKPPLDGLTPLKVESMLPGKHRIEVRSPRRGSGSQDVTIEAGRMIDLRAVLAAAPAAPVAVAPPVAPTAGRAAARRGGQGARAGWPRRKSPPRPRRR